MDNGGGKTYIHKMWIKTIKVPGRGPAPLGRPLKNQGGRSQMTVTEEDDFMSKSDKTFKEPKKRPHNLALSVQNNENAPKRHTKQGI